MVVYVNLSDNPRGAIILVVLWVMTTLSGVFVGLRLYTKLIRRRQVWWDDYIIVVAWVWIFLPGISSGLLKRLTCSHQDLPPRQLRNFDSECPSRVRSS